MEGSQISRTQESGAWGHGGGGTSRWRGGYPDAGARGHPRGTGPSCPQEGAESAAGPAPKEAPGRQGRDFRSPADTSGFVGSRRGGCVSRCRAGGRAGPGPALGPRCWGAAPRHRSARPRATGRGLFLLRLPSTSRRRARTPSMTVRDPQCRGGPALVHVHSRVQRGWLLGLGRFRGVRGPAVQRGVGAGGPIASGQHLWRRAAAGDPLARLCTFLLVSPPRTQGFGALPAPKPRGWSGGSGSVAGY